MTQSSGQTAMATNASLGSTMACCRRGSKRIEGTAEAEEQAARWVSRRRCLVQVDEVGGVEGEERQVEVEAW